MIDVVDEVEFEENKEVKKEKVGEKIIGFMDNHKNACLLVISGISAVIKLIVDCGKGKEPGNKSTTIIHYDNPDPALTMSNKEFKNYLHRKKKEEKFFK